MGKTSKVWKVFNKISDNSVQCRICDKKYAYSGSSTGVMLSHIAKSHSTALDKDKSQPTMSDFIKAPPTPMRRETITDKIVELIARESLPISLVEAGAFKALLKCLEPGYVTPSRKTVSSRIRLLYEHKKEEIRESLVGVQHVSYTTDCWTSIGTRDYMTVTAHTIDEDWCRANFVLETKPVVGVGEEADQPQRHTTEALQNQLERVVEDWGLRRKSVAVVHDNAANVRRIGEGIDAADVGCAAHTLQLCVNTALDSAPANRTLSAAASRLVGHFKHSVVASKALEAEQRQMGIPEHKLVQSMKVRWNSTFDMFKRLKEQRWAICRVLSDRRHTNLGDARTLELKDEQWRLLDGLISALEPFKVATTVLSGEEQTTLSVVVPIMAGILDHHLIVNEDDLPGVKTFKRTATAELTRRFQLCPAAVRGTSGAAPVSPTLKASALDPRHKTLAFVARATREAVIIELRDELPPRPPRQQRLDDDDEDRPAAATAVDFLLTGARQGPDDEADVADQDDADEIDLYLQHAAPPRSTDPTVWWAENHNKFPRVSLLAKKYLTIPATSVPAERIFSSAGNIVNKKRSCLDSDNVDMLVFLKDNLKK
eukprot:XP_797872.3 PREDICTED: zinc finger BED domain-containing protein 1-like [Strongylocentrotus purpuratus]